ncbi:glycosyltransferase family 2 protein [Agromyces salentinus]|uniref:glycosyltransferase family 2 protein n=1 Tax=Agromyces salentinus TaxID=269421 RepID=UPI001478C791|nr:glycosyltransferase family 2 protein [Agromyces salentinus]
MNGSDAPVVSVVLPTYNAEKHIGRAIERLLEQSYALIEIVVVDDRSEDMTVDEIMRYSGDPRLKLVRLPVNQGVANARNVGLDAVSGDYVWFVDADDEWSSDFVQVMLRAALEDAADVVVCSAAFRFGRDLSRKEFVARYRSRKRDLAGEDALEVLLLGTGALWNKLFKRSSLLVRPFPPLSSKSDHGGLLAMLPMLKFVSIVPDVLYTYVQRDGSISNGGVRQPENFLALLSIAKNHLDTVPHTARSRRLSARFRCGIVGRALRENWRYSSEANDQTRRFNSQLTWAQLVSSIVDPRTFLTCAAAKCAPAMSRNLFRRLGRNRWSTRGWVAD